MSLVLPGGCVLDANAAQHTVRGLGHTGHPPHACLRHDMRLAYNPINSTAFYEHDAVFCAVPHLFCPVRRGVLYDYTGTAVPFSFDCNVCGELLGIPCATAKGGVRDRPNWGFNSPWSGWMHDYYRSVPDRWDNCHRHVADVLSRLEFSPPRLPLIDEEYDEQADLLRGLTAAMRCAKSGGSNDSSTPLSNGGGGNSTVTLTIFEAGARWGTWGFRALSLLRLMAPHLEGRAVFWEPDDRHVSGLRAVARLNGYREIDGEIVVNGTAAPVTSRQGPQGHSEEETNKETAAAAAVAVGPHTAGGHFRVFASRFSPKSFAEAAREVPGVIHYFDLDIQGGETMLCSPSEQSLLHLIRAKVKTVKIGTHSPQIHRRLLQCLPRDLRIAAQQPYGSPAFVDQYLREDKDWSAIRNHTRGGGPVQRTAFGPVVNWDGTIVLTNPAFDERC